MKLDKSQRKFCESEARHLRVLAPAGCGKTSALLYRCLHLSKQEQGERFLLVTFTKAAELEAGSRLAEDPDLGPIRDLVTVRTLNAYGYRRLRSEIQHHKLLSSRTDHHFAMQKQLRPVWSNREKIANAITGRGNYGSRLMAVIDELKALGFDHTTDTNLEKFDKRLDSLYRQRLWPQVEAQADSLKDAKILEAEVDLKKQSGRQAFYRYFFGFWREAVKRLHEESTFTFEDQKYWCWLDLRSPGPGGKRKPPVTGAARFAHVLIDEFQYANPLDLVLIKTIAERHRASVTIVDDDDHAIFEWRDATLEYILHLDDHFENRFQTVTTPLLGWATLNTYEVPRPVEWTTAGPPGQIRFAPAESTAEAILEIRRRSGLTWEEMGDLFDVSRRSIHHWASGKPVSTRRERALRQALAAIRRLDRGDQAGTRARLLAVDHSTGLSALDMMREGRFDEITARTEGARAPDPLRIPLSRKARKTRRPPPPPFLLEAEQDRPDVPADARAVRAVRTPANTD